MAIREDVPLTDKSASRVAVTPPPSCTCAEFQSSHVCDHVLMAAAVRMVRRMIDIHTDSEKPH